ncbi:activin receptor type-2A-like [Fopius arisanus]|uniref:Serine/threonine-protein kinase receptor n=1 Tax=Fopius arisanus TaxID=64838 RepID=A0A9R1T5K9_9HYME|nr:PREDICTED: activin receptor type-2A-like [Fopius arisanus]
MAIFLGTLLPIFFVLSSSSGMVFSQDVKGATICEFYNATLCAESKEDCTYREECPPPPIGKRNHCYVLWQHNNVTNTSILKMKGCFYNNQECYNKIECVENNVNRKKQMLFCCCDGDMCNRNYNWDPKPLGKLIIPKEDSESGLNPDQKYIRHSDSDVDSDQHFFILMMTISSGIFIMIIVILARCFGCKSTKLGDYFHPSPLEAIPPDQSQPNFDLQLIKLVEVKARGKFGCVWKAEFKNDLVAVKIFPSECRQSWQMEQDIFKLPRMNHDDILQFIGSEKKENDLKSEFWLVTAYHEWGSLYDYLKTHVITWTQVCRIAESMGRGLMHLHEEIPGDKIHGHKPAIAHRDIKSKNILLKSDMTACIADFGLTLVFHPDKPCGDAHAQVGTHRYMAPEVLEGAINFNRDSFLRIDMYAFGLVLWELMSRCTAQEGPVGEYKLPFQEEIGMHPTLEEMQDHVVRKRVRPAIPETWRKHPGFQSMCDTIEECWDHEAEARLSASCVTARIGGFNQLRDFTPEIVIDFENIEEPIAIAEFTV